MKAEAIKELWVLQWDHGEVMPPMDGESECFMAFPTENDAEDEARTSIEEYGEGRQSLTVLRIHPSRQEGKTFRYDAEATNASR